MQVIDPQAPAPFITTPAPVIHDTRTKPIEREAHVATLQQLAERVLMPDMMFTSVELATLGTSCLQRLASRR